MKVPSLMRMVGRAHWLYQTYVRSHLPAPVQSTLRRLVVSEPAHWASILNAEYNFWRVKKPATALLGPQYRRSRKYIEIDITWACNLNCYNCNRSCEQAPTGAHMTVEQIQSFIDESVAADARWERIRLLGGEPTVHKQFFAILDLVRGYRDRHSPATVIEVITNGHGAKVNAAIERIPSDVVVKNTAKETKVQPHFGSFNVAPQDLPEYRDADFRNGCWVVENCGFGLGPHGYYPCAIAGGLDRIYGWNIARRHLPLAGDDMHDQLEKACSHCGHFKRRLEEPLETPLMSATWERAYAAYRKQRPSLPRYAGGEAPKEELEPATLHPGLQKVDTRSRLEGTGKF